MVRCPVEAPALRQHRRRAKLRWSRWRIADWAATWRFQIFVGPIHTNFPLLVLVEPETSWRITLIYDRANCRPTAIQPLGHSILRAPWQVFPQRATAPLGSLLEALSPPATRRAQNPCWRAQSQNYVLAADMTLKPNRAASGRKCCNLKRSASRRMSLISACTRCWWCSSISRLCEALGQEFPLIAMFQYPTIRTLARHLVREEEGISDAPLRNRAQLQRNALARLQSAGARR